MLIFNNFNNNNDIEIIFSYFFLQHTLRPARDLRGRKHKKTVGINVVKSNGYRGPMKVSKINSELKFGNARTKVEANFDKEIPNAKRRKGIEDPTKATKSAEAKKSQREWACLKALTSIPFRTVNLWMRTRNWHTFRWKLTLDCHSGKSGNRLAKSRNINAHGILGPHAWLESETLQPMEKSTRAWA